MAGFAALFINHTKPFSYIWYVQNELLIYAICLENVDENPFDSPTFMKTSYYLKIDFISLSMESYQGSI